MVHWGGQFTGVRDVRRMYFSFAMQRHSTGAMASGRLRGANVNRFAAECVHVCASGRAVSQRTQRIRLFTCVSASHILLTLGFENG